MSQFDLAELSPEAKTAAATYQSVERDVATILVECASGRELVAKVFPEDVAMASELNVSQTVPIFEDEAYRQMR